MLMEHPYHVEAERGISLFSCVRKVNQRLNPERHNLWAVEKHSELREGTWKLRKTQVQHSLTILVEHFLPSVYFLCVVRFRWFMQIENNLKQDSLTLWLSKLWNWFTWIILFFFSKHFLFSLFIFASANFKMSFYSPGTLVSIGPEWKTHPWWSPGNVIHNINNWWVGCICLLHFPPLSLKEIRNVNTLSLQRGEISEGWQQKKLLVNKIMFCYECSSQN